MPISFHKKTGCLVDLSNNNFTAERNRATQEFNNGMVFSSEPLIDDNLFEVRIIKKVPSWSGSIEIGVTGLDPSNISFPASATGFREKIWLMSGRTILKDGHSMMDEYGEDLDQLSEGDTIGVMRTQTGELHFYINGVDQGVASLGIPTRVFAVVDMYGKCAQISITNSDADQAYLAAGSSSRASVLSSEVSDTSTDRGIIFHEKCGSLVKLSNANRSAQRMRPLDDFNNGVVMTNRPIKDDELFEIRLDHLVDKWSGSIEMGVTKHNPNSLEFPATMTNMRSGTIMMSGQGVLINGKGTVREYGKCSLDELVEGDRIGLLRKNNGNLHYFINGADQGIAAPSAPSTIWGVIDLYGMAVKVTITESPVVAEQPSERDRNVTELNSNTLLNSQLTHTPQDVQLMFQALTSSGLLLTNGQRTAQLLGTEDCFNSYTLVTNRILLPNEKFEIRFDQISAQTLAYFEFGVTSHHHRGLLRFANMPSGGKWVWTWCGLMLDQGTFSTGHYSMPECTIEAGTTLGVALKSGGKLHFYVNGIDRGMVMSRVPSEVYGLVILRDQVTQLTIIDDHESQSPYSDLSFHEIHGSNAQLAMTAKNAMRTNTVSDFNGAIVLSNRPLRDNEVFEVLINNIVSRWSGSLEAGVTLIPPEELSFPSTMTDITSKTWILSGSTLMKDGESILNGYKLDLDSLSLGTRIGIMRARDSTLHYFMNGEDMGVACYNVPTGVYAVLDLYGQCSEVTICSPSSPVCITHDATQAVAPTDSSTKKSLRRLSQCCGRNVTIKNLQCSAIRTRGCNEGLIFSGEPLRTDDLFEIVIDQTSHRWSGSLRIGLTSLTISDSTLSSTLPPSATDIFSKATWVVVNSRVMSNGVILRENYCPSLCRLQNGDRVGIKRSSDHCMHLFINGEDLGAAVSNIPKNVFAVIDLFGAIEAISVISSLPASIPTIKISHTHEVKVDLDKDILDSTTMEFHGNQSGNVLLTRSGHTASRISGYNNGLVICNRPLKPHEMFLIRLERINNYWNSSLSLGVIGVSPIQLGSLPLSVYNLNVPSVFVQGDLVVVNGKVIRKKYGQTLECLDAGDYIGISVDECLKFHIHVNGIDQGPISVILPPLCYPFVDIYGRCEEISIVSVDELSLTEAQMMDNKEKANLEESKREKDGSNNLIVRDQFLGKACTYRNMCQTLLTSLILPETFFDPRSDCCYCEDCHKLRSTDTHQTHGDPPKQFSVPLGWCRFGLRKHLKCHSPKIYEKWHVAYQGTRAEYVRRILDSGDLSITGPPSLLTFSTNICDKEKPNFDQGEQVRMSPSINYATNLVWTSHTKCKTTEQPGYKLAFQLWVKPGSYTVSGSVGRTEQDDASLGSSEVEWLTKERGSTHLAALLLLVE